MTRSWGALLLFLFSSPAWMTAASPVTWEDVTPHHSRARGLSEASSMPEEGFVRRIPSETVFIYRLHGEVLVQGQGQTSSLELPLCTGGTAVFDLVESSILPPALREEFPEVWTYHGVAAGGITADVVLSPVGIRAQVWTGMGRCFVDPHTKGRADLHTVYSHADVEPGQRARHGPAFPHDSDTTMDGRRLMGASQGLVVPPAGKAQNFVYRVAIACSYEYVQLSQKYGGPMALLATTVARWSGIWQRDLGIKLELVENQTQLFKFAAGALPNNNNEAWFVDPRYGVNAIVLAGVPSSSFDFGHFFHVGNAGGLGQCCPCDPSSKAWGGTASMSPTGDNLDVDFVAHQAAHQFAVPLTWTGSKGMCTSQMFGSSIGVELGSGSTLMSYAGGCGKDDLQPAANPYFHVVSLSQFQVWSQMSVFGIGGQAAGCGVVGLSATKRPNVTVPEQCTIPRLTAFWLVGNATTDKPTALYYTWEQVDMATSQSGLDQEQTDGPLTVSLLPSTSGNVRYFPNMSTMLDAAESGQILVLDRLSSVRRTLHFALTARDRALNSTSAFGSWHADTVDVQVAQLGPLVITQPLPGKVIQTGLVDIVWQLQGGTKVANASDDLALLAGRYEVAYSFCPRWPVSENYSSTEISCGTTWTVLAQNQGVNSRGVGRITAYLPDTAAGKVVFRVQGVAQASSPGCTFLAVTSPRRVVVRAAVVPTVVSTLPANGTSGLPAETSFFSVKFSGPVWISTTDTVASMQRTGAASPVYWTVPDVLLDDMILVIPMASIGANLALGSQYTVNVVQGGLCSMPKVPCPSGAAVMVQPFMFSTALFIAAQPVPVLLPQPPALVDWKGDVLNFTFQAPVVAGTGNISISLLGTNITWCLLDISADGVTVSVQGLMVSLADCHLRPGSQWSLALAPGLVQSMASVPFRGLKTFLFNTTGDPTPPALQFIDPADGAEDVPEYKTIYLLFNNSYITVAKKELSIRFVPLAGIGSEVVIPLTDCCDFTNQVIVMVESGEVWIRPAVPLGSSTTYSLVIPNGVLQSYSIPFPGLKSGDLTFSTGDTIPPNLLDISFQTGSEDNLVMANITFDSPVQPGVGTFWLLDLFTNATGAYVNANEQDYLQFKGNSLLVDFSAHPLPGPTTYALQWSGGVVKDLHDNAVMEKNDLTSVVTTSFELLTWMVEVLDEIPNASSIPLPPAAFYNVDELQWPLDQPSFGEYITCDISEVTCISFSFDKLGAAFNKTSFCSQDGAGCSCAQGARKDPCRVQQGSGRPDLYVCVPKAYDCPAPCEDGQKVCIVKAFNSTSGLPTPVPDITCALLEGSCPCNADFEHQCSYAPYSWCMPNGSPCPEQRQPLGYGSWMSPGGSLLELVDFAKVAYPTCSDYQVAVLFASYTDQPAFTNAVFHCVTSASDTRCGVGALSSPCQASDSIFICVPAMLGQCPTVCNDIERTCLVAKYDSSGKPTSPTVACVAADAACPCNAAWEHQCGLGATASCYLNTTYCPLDCGPNVTCMHWNGTRTCGSGMVCSCDQLKELACQRADGVVECLNKGVYKSCPAICTGGVTSCPKYSFAADGSPTVGQICTGSNSSSTACPVLCGTGAVTCGPASGVQTCRPASPGCPPALPICQYTEQLCMVMNYGAQEGDTSLVGMCVPLLDTCPCGINAKLCNFHGQVFCVFSGAQCPTDCEPTSRLCYLPSYDAKGQIDPAGPVVKSCTPVDQSCNCGPGLSCHWTDQFGEVSELCLSKTVDRFPQRCPVSSKPGQTWCQIVHYNTTGFQVGFSQESVYFGAPCRGGNNTLQCLNEMGRNLYIPKVDAVSQKVSACPVYCDSATQDTCNVPSFGPDGVVTSFLTSCVPKGEGCVCTGTLSKTCTTFVQGVAYRECVFVGAYCPSCSPAQTACPEVLNYFPNGTIAGRSVPTGGPLQPQCAASLQDCGCGREARQCSWKSKTVCQFRGVPCPTDCADGFRLCQVLHYKASGLLLNEQQQCVALGFPCPCGSNAQRCSVSDLCVPTAMRPAVCGCPATQKVCHVDDYNPAGKKLRTRLACAPMEKPCPCGTNTNPCPNPLDALSFLCTPMASSDGQTECAMPCTPTQEGGGLQTCVQINLNKKGEFLSRTVSCVWQGYCQPGLNQKRCPSGAVINAAAPCVDLYGVQKTAPGFPGLAGVNSSQSQTFTLAFTLTDVPSAADLGTLSSGMLVDLASMLQLTPSLFASVNLVSPPSKSRRLDAASTQTVQAVVTVQNMGESNISPEMVGTRAKRLLLGGDPTMLAIFARAGSVNIQAGVAASTAFKTTQTRADAVVSLSSSGPDGASIGKSSMSKTTTPKMVLITVPTTGRFNTTPLIPLLSATSQPDLKVLLLTVLLLRAQQL